MSRRCSTTYPPGRSPLDLAEPAAAPDFHIQRDDEHHRGQESTLMSAEPKCIPPPESMPTWRQRKLPHSVLWDVVGQLNRENFEGMLEVLDLIEQAHPGRIDSLLQRHREAERERDARSDGYGSLEERDDHTRAQREDERAEWVEWLDAGGRDRLLAWQPAPYERPAVERTVWLAVHPDGPDPVHPRPDVEWDVLGAGTSPGAAHRAYVEDTRDRMLDPSWCVPDDPREGTLTDVPSECAYGDPITALLAPHVRYLRLTGDPELVERVARSLSYGHWLDDEPEAPAPAATSSETSAVSAVDVLGSVFHGIFLDDDEALAQELLAHVPLERVSRACALCARVEEQRIARERARAEESARSTPAAVAAREAERAAAAAAAEPLVGPFREAVLAAAAAYMPPTPVVDGESVLVLVQRYMRPEVELDGHNGIEATGTDWPEVYRAAEQEYSRIQLHDLSAEELVSRYNDPASVVPAEKLGRWMDGLVPLVVTGPEGVDVRALLQGIRS